MIVRGAAVVVVVGLVVVRVVVVVLAVVFVVVGYVVNHTFWPILCCSKIAKNTLRSIIIPLFYSFVNTFVAERKNIFTSLKILIIIFIISTVQIKIFML